MDYSKDFLETQKNMFEAFQKMYTPFWNTEKEGNTFNNMMKEYLDTQKKFFENLGGDYNPFTIYQKMINAQDFNSEAFKTFLDMQNQYFDNFKKFGDFYNFGLKDNSFSPFNFPSINFENINEAFDAYKDFYSKYDFTKLLNPNVTEMFEKMSNANKFYLYMYDFWKKFNDEFSENFDKNTEKFKNFINENANLTYNMVISTLPDEFKPYLEQPRELINKYFDTMIRFFEPWKSELNDLRNLLIEGMLDNDGKKVADFFRLWKEQYDKTFGKILNSPALGLNRNVIEQQNKAFDSFVDLLLISTEFTASLNTVQNSAFKNIMEEYSNMIKDGFEAKSFEEFFNYWSSKMETSLIDYFGSKEFSKLVAAMGENMMDFRIETNRLIEDYLADTPLVTKNELDSISKNIYNLKKEVKKLNKEIEELKSSEKKDDKPKEK